MDVTISVSERTEVAIRDKADASGKEFTEFLGEFVESSFAAEKDNGQGSNNPGRRHSLMRFAGMFSSGVTDTSERMHEILYSEDLDPAQGFGTDK